MLSVIMLNIVMLSVMAPIVDITVTNLRPIKAVSITTDVIIFIYYKCQ
jgi:hypothetical protein